MYVRQRYNIPIPDTQREYCIVEELSRGKQVQVDFGEYNMRDGQCKCHGSAPLHLTRSGYSIAP